MFHYVQIANGWMGDLRRPPSQFCDSGADNHLKAPILPNRALTKRANLPIVLADIFHSPFNETAFSKTIYNNYISVALVANFISFP